MKIKRGNPDSNYTVAINNYANHRLFNNSTYRTGVDTQLYRTQPDKMVISLLPFRLMVNFYVDLQQLNGENYDTLKRCMIMLILIQVIMILKWYTSPTQSP